MSRLAGCFERLRAAKRAALVPYITAGDPNPHDTVALLHTLVEAGAAGVGHGVELGVPFSDPMADGSVIQAACERALRHNFRHGVGLGDKDLNTVAAIEGIDL